MFLWVAELCSHWPDHRFIAFQIPAIVLTVTLSIPPHHTDDTSDSVRLIRVRGHVLLLPRLVLDNPGSIHRGRDQRPDHPSSSCPPPQKPRRTLGLMTFCCIGIHRSSHGGRWYRSGLIRWHPLDGGYGRSGIVRMRIGN